MKQPSLFGPDTENEEGIFSGGTSKDNQDAKKRILSVPNSGIATSTPITDSGFADEGKNSSKIFILFYHFLFISVLEFICAKQF